MWTSFLLSSAVLLAAVSTLCTGASYKKTGECKNNNEQIYKYHAKEAYFGGDNPRTLEVTIHFKVHCISDGTLGDKRARLFELDITETKLAGNINTQMESEASEPRDYDAAMKGFFEFVQTEDGSVPVTRHSREELQEIVNIKKAIASCFQANFMGTETKEEDDTQSRHTSHYTYEASAQDVENGVLKMHRHVTSDDVETYSSTMPRDEVKLDKEDDIEYRQGVLTRSSGTVSLKLMPKENKSPEDDIQDDVLETESRRKREDGSDTTNDPDEIKTFDSSFKTNHFEAEGSYTVELVGEQRRLLRRRRSIRDTSNSVETSLMAYVNQSRQAIERMMDLRESVGDVKQALKNLHDDTTNTDIAHKIEALVKLESKYGPVPDYTPVIKDVLEYLNQLFGSKESKDVKMRLLLYFIISPEGSLRSQMALLRALETAVSDEETDAVIMYIALLANPQPQMVAELENLIPSDVHSSDPLLLAYGAIIPKASPELQQRMVLFLTNRLPEAETNTTSLIHHILSLGNSGSPHASNHLIDHLGHPESDIQLTVILAMRFLMKDPSVQKSLKDLLTEPHLTEDHLVMMAKSLVYSCERAKMNFEDKPYPSDLVEQLVSLAFGVHNEELHSALSAYLNAINTPDSLKLLQILKYQSSPDTNDKDTNETRFRRGTQWDERNDLYNLVAPLSERQSDVRILKNRLSYIWGKRFGVDDANLQVAAGGLVGASNVGCYKVFGHAVAKGNLYDRSLTFLEFLVLRQKEYGRTLSRIYACVVGITVKNLRRTDAQNICLPLKEPIFQGREYTVFDVPFSFWVIVGTLNANIKATVQFSADMYLEFCDNLGSFKMGAGLSPTLTLKLSGSGYFEALWTGRAGLTLTGTLNYKVMPEVNSEVCYKQSQIRVKNCIGVYHQWTDNKLDLYAWYSWRGWCGWWFCTGSDAYKQTHKINALSYTWKLPGTSKQPLWERCDQPYTC